MTPVRDTNGKITGWSVRWREKDGRRPRRIFADKALAERLVAEKRSAQAGKKRRLRGAKRPGGATLADYFATGYGPKIGRSRKSKRKVAPLALRWNSCRCFDITNS
jgi:hypothetical protein